MSVADDRASDVDPSPSAHSEVMVRAMMETQRNWTVVLDGIDGMVAETMRRGWSEEQARRIVSCAFGRPEDGSDD